MKFGIGLPHKGPMAHPDKLGDLAKHAESLGFHTIFIGDHIVQPQKIRSRYSYSESGKPPMSDFSGEWLEQLTTLSFIAAKTNVIRLLTSVMILPYRNPLHAAKILTTIDILSKGRLTVGVGIGWMKEEFEALGSPPFDERGSVSDEYIRLFKEVWTKDTPKFHGNYYDFSELIFLPKPIQKPHPPIWVGGESPAAMKRAVKLCDGWYPIGTNPDFPLRNTLQFRSALDMLSMYAEREGRSMKDLDVGFLTNNRLMNEKPNEDSKEDMFSGTPDKILSDVLNLENIGVDYIGFGNPGKSLSDLRDRMDLFSDAIMTQF